MDRIGELCQAVASGAPLSSLNDDILIEALSQCEVAVDGGTDETAILAAAPGSDIRRAAPVLRSIRLPLSLIDQLMNGVRSEEHTSELQSLMRISYAVFCFKKKIH